ncbi:hypothetical protein QFZ52_000323 [Arthrobacter woluwensis]|nr:hypothetical protein [Arthrobacter woluwensis]
MLIRRTTRDVPFSTQGRLVPSPNTTRSKLSLPGDGLAVPSTWPKRFRMVVPGFSVPYARRKPCWIHRTVVKLRLSFSSIR